MWMCAPPCLISAHAIASRDDDSPAAAQTPEADASTFDCPDDDASPPTGPIEVLPLSGVGVRGAALLLSGETGGEVEGAVIWTSSGRESDAEQVSIQFMVEVDGRSLLAASPHSTVPIEVYGYLVDETGTMVGHLGDRILLEGCRRAQMIEETGLKFVGELSAVPGLYSFRVLVRNGLTERFFLGRREVDVRFEDPLDVFLLPPLVAEPQDSWVMAGEHGLELGSVRERIPVIRSWPSAMPAWRADEPLEMVIGCSELVEGRQVSARLFDRLGNPVLGPDVEVGQAVSTAHGVAFYRLSVAPSDVPVGEYRFAVVVTDANSGQTVSQSLPVLIHDLDSALVWTDPAAPRTKNPQPLALWMEEPIPEDEPKEEGSPAEAAAPEAATPEADVNIFDCPDDESPPPTGQIEALALGGVGARGAALLLSGQNGGEVEGAVIWTRNGREGDAEQVSIQFMVEVEGRSLLAASPHLRIPIEVYGYLVDETGTVVGHLADGVLLEDCRRAQVINETGLKFVGELSVPPGLYSFRVLVRNRLTRRFFLARRDLDVRTKGPLDVYLLPPLVAEPKDSWVMAGEHGLVLGSVRNEIPGIRSWPSAMPAWRADEPLEMVIGCSELGEGRPLSARLFDRLGHPVLDPDVEVGQPVSTAHGLAFYRVSVAAPDVPVGEYRFAVVLKDANSGQAVSQSLPVLIHDRDSGFVWTDPAAPRTTKSLPMFSQTDRPTPEALEVETMRAAYIDALRMWSEGEAVAARRRLAEIEHPLESTASARSWRRLITVERLTALTLAKSHPASLMAVALLHRDMYSWYQARREPQLARHSWQMAAMMARIAPTIDGWEPAGRFGECMLLDLASRLIGSGHRHPVRQLLEAAVKIAPGSAPVLLGLGALYERTGFPDEAVDELTRLYKKHPGILEGRLRLAVNRARIGEDKAAEELLRGLLAPSSPLWIRTLAYQELGRLLIDKGRIDEAEVQLREGVARIPGNQRLQMQLAHTLDQAWRPKEAESVVDQLETHGSQQSTSPRYRYSAWPDLDADRVHSTLVDAQILGLEALREALP